MKKFIYKDLRITFVFRYVNDKISQEMGYDSLFRTKHLGFFFRRDMCVGKKEFNKPSKWKNNMRPSYMIGINLIWCTAWIDISKGVMHME